MNKVWLLTKTSLQNQFDLSRWFWERSFRRAELQRGAKAGTAARRPGALSSGGLKQVIAPLVIGLGAAGIFSLFFLHSWILAKALAPYGLLRVLVLQAILLPSIICFVSSLYTAPAQLFYCKDYDLLLSLPVKTSTVLMSKMANLLLVNASTSTLLAAPPLIVYGWKSGAGPVYWLFAAVVVPCLPVVPMTGAAVLGVLAGRLTARFRRSNQVIANLLLALLMLLTVGWFQLSLSGRAAMAGVNAVFDAVRTWYPPAGLCFDALTGPSLLALLLFVGLSAGVLLLFCALFARSFRAILSRLAAAPARGNYQLQPLAAASVMRALFVKEIKGYFGCPIYVMNTLVGMVMLTILSAAPLCVSGATRAKWLLAFGSGEGRPVTVLLLVTFLTSICCTTASSISLEGRSLWILKSAPVDPLTVFKSKLLLNLAVTWPLLAVNSLLLMASLHLDVGHWLLLWGVASVYAVFMAVTGLVINLLFPKLEFKNPTAVVKQSRSVLLTVVVGLVAVVSPIYLYMQFWPAHGPYELFAGLVAVFLLVISCLLWQVLRTRGVGWFQRLN